jgi:hypothetical protein
MNDPQEPSSDYREQQDSPETPTDTLCVTDRSSIQFRGFSTSITDAFQDAQHRQTDACALACCGMLQSDKDRYMIMGISPPSLVRRLFVHILTPLILFATACYGATHISNAYLNQLISTLLVAFILLLIISQALCKGRWKRVMVRKELLWRKYRLRNGEATLLLQEPEDDDESLQHAKEYLQGQTRCDLHCAHAFMGCYVTDLDRNSQPGPPIDCCATTFRCLMISTLPCRCHVQCCGMCALAQEAREVAQWVPASQRRLDYITMQPAVDYHAHTLLLEHGDSHLPVMTRCSRFVAFSFQSLSKLSQQLIVFWAAAVAVLILLGVALNYSLGHVMVFVATFAHAFVLLALLQICSPGNTISWDLCLKAFSCGFWITSLLAVVWESMAGICVRFMVNLLMALSGVNVAIDEDGYESWWTGFGHVASASSRQDYLRQYGEDHPLIFALLLILQAYILAALLEELVKHLGYLMLTDHPDFWDKRETEEAISALLDRSRKNIKGDMEKENVSSHQQKKNRENAKRLELLESLPALTERSSCRQGATITLSMVAVALGFACCENLVYIFIYNDNAIEIGKLSSELKYDSLVSTKSCLFIHSHGFSSQSFRDLSSHRPYDLSCSCRCCGHSIHWSRSS